MVDSVEYEAMYDESRSQCSCSCGGSMGPFSGAGCGEDGSIGGK